MENTEMATASVAPQQPVAANLPRGVWQIGDDGKQFQLLIEGEIAATIERWINAEGSKDFISWAWWAGGNNQLRGFEDTLSEVWAAVNRGLRGVAPLDPGILEAYDETPAIAADAPPPAHDLADRLGKMLAEVVDVAILTVKDPDGDREIALRLAHFHPELANRAAELLEEAGH